MRLCDEVVPGLACGVDDGVEAFEDAIGEPVRPHVLPDIFNRVQFGSARGQKDRCDIFRHDELARRVPASAVKQEGGVRSRGDVPGDFVEMQLHGFGVGEGQSQRRAGSARWTDGAEQPGVGVALISRLARPCSPPRPLTDNAVLLADARLVLEPQFNGRACRKLGQMRFQRRREVFLKASTICSSCPGWRGRALTCEKPICFSNVPT